MWFSENVEQTDRVISIYYSCPPMNKRIVFLQTTRIHTECVQRTWWNALSILNVPFKFSSILIWSFLQRSSPDRKYYRQPFKWASSLTITSMVSKLLIALDWKQKIESTVPCFLKIKDWYPKSIWIQVVLTFLHSDDDDRLLSKFQSNWFNRNLDREKDKIFL